MPELPEVETVRRGLARVVIGKTISEIHVHETRFRFPLQPKLLRQWIAQQVIVAVERRAKYVLCRMSNEAHLVMHLGMSGRLLWCDGALPLEKHDHVQFVLNDGDELRFRDPRRFGLIDAIPPGQRDAYVHFQHLGIEPLSHECTAKFLCEQAQGLSRPVKNFLMDANRIVGVGNIYANESLFRAGIHPEMPVGKLHLQDWQRLVKAVRYVLKTAIASGGTTLNDFYNSDGEMGYFQQYLKVYSRAGEACEACGAKIKRIVQLGRSTYFCPRCQSKTSRKRL